MREEYDFKDAVIKDYSNEITDKDKLKIMLDAFREATNISKEELKREVDLVLA